jgi:hypothetical protein
MKPAIVSTFGSNEMLQSAEHHSECIDLCAELSFSSCSYGYDPFGLGKKPEDFAK